MAERPLLPRGGSSSSVGGSEPPRYNVHTGRRLVPEAGVRLGGGSSFHFLSNVIAGACLVWALEGCLVGSKPWRWQGARLATPAPDA